MQSRILMKPRSTIFLMLQGTILFFLLEIDRGAGLDLLSKTIRMLNKDGDSTKWASRVIEFNRLITRVRP